jgi:hypothetical protein
LPGPYEASKIEKTKFSCRLCGIVALLETQKAELAALRSLADTEEADKAAALSQLQGKDKIDAKTSSWAVILKTPTVSSIKTPPALPAPQLRQAADEMQEIEKRKLCLVVVGMTEGGTDVEDVVKYANYTCNLNPSLTETDIQYTERLGRGNGTARILRLKMTSAAARRAVLMMRPAQHLQPQNIFIRPDLTKAQQEVDKLLRAELLKKGADNFKISRGRIIPRDIQPINASSVPVALPAHSNTALPVSQAILLTASTASNLLQTAAATPEAANTNGVSFTLANTNAPTSPGAAAKSIAPHIAVAIPSTSTTVAKPSAFGTAADECATRTFNKIYTKSRYAQLTTTPTGGVKGVQGGATAATSLKMKSATASTTLTNMAASVKMGSVSVTRSTPVGTSPRVTTRVAKSTAATAAVSASAGTVAPAAILITASPATLVAAAAPIAVPSVTISATSIGEADSSAATTLVATTPEATAATTIVAPALAAVSTAAVSSTAVTTTMGLTAAATTSNPVIRTAVALPETFPIVVPMAVIVTPVSTPGKTAVVENILAKAAVVVEAEEKTHQDQSVKKKKPTTRSTNRQLK